MEANTEREMQRDKHRQREGHGRPQEFFQNIWGEFNFDGTWTRENDEHKNRTPKSVND